MTAYSCMAFWTRGIMKEVSDYATIGKLKGANDIDAFEVGRQLAEESMERYTDATQMKRPEYPKACFLL